MSRAGVAAIRMGLMAMAAAGLVAHGALAAPPAELCWPGSSWTEGSARAGTSPLRPDTWGTLTFDPGPLAASSASLDEAGSAAVPYGPTPVTVNGAVRGDEWADAVTVVHRYGAGAQLAVQLKHTDAELLVALVVPAAVGVRAGTVVELCWATSPASGARLDASHHWLRVTIGRGGANAVELAAGEAGAWHAMGAPRGNALRAVAGNGGMVPGATCPPSSASR
jgi:hypothetical protein